MCIRDRSGIITLRAYSVPQSVKDKRSKSWEKVKFLQLAQEIAGRHGLTLETYGITDQTYDDVCLLYTSVGVTAMSQRKSPFITSVVLFSLSRNRITGVPSSAPMLT